MVTIATAAIFNSEVGETFGGSKRPQENGQTSAIYLGFEAVILLPTVENRPHLLRSVPVAPTYFRIFLRIAYGLDMVLFWGLMSDGI